MAYPGIYRAKAQRLDGTNLTASIPQVFGETPVTITAFVGDPPKASDMGWVAFHAGRPEYPVWLGVGTGGGGGGGGGGTVTDTLWVGTSAPTDAAIELWYDTDEPSAGGGGGGTGGTYTHNQSTPATVWTITHNLGFFPQVTVVDSTGEQVEGEVDFTNANTVTVSFSAAFSGKAYLS